MKRLLMVTKEKRYHDIFLKELVSVFSGFLKFDTYCDVSERENSIPREIPTPDILVITNPYSFSSARPFIDENTKTFMLSFTFGKEIINQLKSFPAGTEALVCCKYYSDAHHAAYTLHEMGIQNLNLYVNYEGNRNMVGKDIDIALVLDDEDIVPENINTVLDLQPMYLSLNTILDIAMAADIMCDELEERILNYCSKLSLPQNHTSFFFNTSSMASLSLRAVTDCIDYGMIIVDQNEQIINYNDHLKSIFKIEQNISGKTISQIPEFSYIKREMMESGEVKDKLIDSGSKILQLLMSKEKINRDDKNYDVFLVLFKDITEIHSLEVSFKKQVNKRGHFSKHFFEEIVHKGEKMKTLLERCRKIATIDKPTLIVGESGTGKEIFAGSIHNASSRKSYPYVALNCATIPENLLESELFGYEDGAFTGAKKGGKTGLFQIANKGTLFLDEIGELSLEMQAKLLRVLEEKEIMKVGGDEIISIDTRVIAATNRDLRALVEEGKFRLDLFYRLNTLTVSIPPLRDRLQDIPILMEYFAETSGKKNVQFSQEVLQFILNYTWPGNVRELRNCVEYMVSIGENPLGADDLPDYLLEEYKKIVDPQADDCHEQLLEEFVGTNRKNIVFILDTLKDSPLGRRKLLEKLQNLGLSVSEYRLRIILKQLNGLSLIRFGSGSAGCQITEEGLKVLRKLSNR